MHVVIAAYNNFDLRSYIEREEKIPKMYERFISHKGSCIKINVDVVLKHQKYLKAQNLISGHNHSEEALLSTKSNQGYASGLQLVLWTGSPDLIANSNTMMGRFTLPSPYGVLHGYELSGAELTLNVHDPVTGF